MDRQSNRRAARPDARTRLCAAAWPLLAAAAFSAALPGCQIIIGVMQMVQGFPENDCDFKEKTHGRRLDEKGKKVAILCLSESTAKLERPSLDADIIGELTRRFQAHKIKVIDSYRVTNWLDDHEFDDSTDLAEIGPEFGVDFIVLVKFNDFGCLEENSRDLYRGHAEGKLVVVELKGSGSGKAKAKQIYDRPFQIRFPENQPVQSAEMTPASFQQKFLDRLSVYLAQKFYDHRVEEEM